MKGFTRNAKSPIAAPDNSQACANKTSFALVRPGFLLGVAGLLVAAALTWASQSEQPSQPYLDAISQTAAAATAASFERASAQLETRTATAAQGAAVIDAVQRQDPTALRAAEAQLKSWGRALDVQINLRKQGQIDDNRPAPMNYAGLDMLNQAEVGTAPPLEAHKVGQRWIVYSVAPIRAVAGQQVLGTLLIAVDLQQLLDPLIENLPKPGDPQQLGEFRLSQRFGEEPAQVLFQSGIASSGTRYPIASGSRNWTLEFTPGPGSQYQTPWLSLGMAVVALLLAIAALWAGLTLTCRRLRAQVEADARQLSQLLQELSGGKAVKSFSLSLPELNGLAQSLARFSLRDKPAPVGKKPTAPPDTPAPAWLDPTFQNSDILDIDILEPDDIGPEPAIAAPASDLPPALPLSIFRAYDIRGVVGTSLTAETAYWIGRAVGAQSLALDEANVCVGRDGRLSGPMLVQQLIQGLHDSGCHVTDVGLVPTPALYYAAHVLEGKSAVMLTGSHNPADYNGFKIVIAGDTLANDQILALHTRIRINALPKGQGSVSQVDILPRYFETIAKDIVVARRLKVVVDCGNGAAGVIAPQLIEALGCDVIALFCEVDGNFPNHHPDPGKPENLADLIAKVRETGADIGLAFDGDGDRVGVVTNAGTIIYPDRLLMLFAKDVLARNPGADIIFDVKCTRRLTPLIKEHGGRPVMWKTGHSLIKKQMKISGALLAGEMSGHIFFKERWYGFDDGLYSAARLLEILSQDKSSAEELFAAFPDDISTPEINIDVTDEGKFSIIDALQRDAQWGEANLTTLDGVRVDYPRGWGLVRASNTTPVLVLRFEAEDQAELERIQDVFRLQLHHVAPDLKLPF